MRTFIKEPDRYLKDRKLYIKRIQKEHSVKIAQKYMCVTKALMIMNTSMNNKVKMKVGIKTSYDSFKEFTLTHPNVKDKFVELSKDYAELIGNDILCYNSDRSPKFVDLINSMFKDWSGHRVFDTKRIIKHRVGDKRIEIKVFRLESKRGSDIDFAANNLYIKPLCKSKFREKMNNSKPE